MRHLRIEARSRDPRRDSVSQLETQPPRPFALAALPANRYVPFAMRALVSAFLVAMACGFLFALAWPVFAQSVLPDGAGKDVTVKVCGQCHAADIVASVRRTPDGWRETIAAMVQVGATATDQELQTILEYVSTHFKGEADRPLDLEYGHSRGARKRGGSVAQGGRGADRAPREKGPVQDARRSQERPGSRLQEDRSPKRSPRVSVRVGLVGQVGRVGRVGLRPERRGHERSNLRDTFQVAQQYLRKGVRIRHARSISGSGRPRRR